MHPVHERHHMKDVHDFAGDVPMDEEAFDARSS
jgi:hypothetical protein